MFKCSYKHCNKEYREKANLYTHIKRKHLNVEEDDNETLSDSD